MLNTCDQDIVCVHSAFCPGVNIDQVINFCDSILQKGNLILLYIQGHPVDNDSWIVRSHLWLCVNRDYCKLMDAIHSVC